LGIENCCRFVVVCLDGTSYRINRLSAVIPSA